MYQYVQATDECPKYVASFGIWAATLLPARYHSTSRLVAKVWRKSCNRGPRPHRRWSTLLLRPHALDTLQNHLRTEPISREAPRSETKKKGVL